jgi:S1-C subfamily serine protease
MPSALCPLLCIMCVCLSLSLSLFLSLSLSVYVFVHRQLHAGDVIVAVNGRAVDESTIFEALTGDDIPGTLVTLTVRRYACVKRDLVQR